MILKELNGKEGTYTINEQIGQGSGGTIYSGIRKYEDREEKVAIKVISRGSNRNEFFVCYVNVIVMFANSSKLRIEKVITKLINLQSNFANNYIIHYYEVILTQSDAYIISELCSHGDLYSYMNKHLKQKKQTPNYIAKMFNQLADGLCFLHEHEIIHRDIKPENILLTLEGDEIIPKITDFGISSFNQTCSVVGTLNYIAPEIFHLKPYSFPADIWSLGCTINELITYRQLFAAKKQSALIHAIKEFNQYQIPNNEYKPIHELIGKCIKQDPERRLDAHQLKDQSNKLMKSLQEKTQENIIEKEFGKGPNMNENKQIAPKNINIEAPNKKQEIILEQEIQINENKNRNKEMAHKNRDNQAPISPPSTNSCQILLEFLHSPKYQQFGKDPYDVLETYETLPYADCYDINNYNQQISTENQRQLWFVCFFTDLLYHNDSTEFKKTFIQLEESTSPSDIYFLMRVMFECVQGENNQQQIQSLSQFMNLCEFKRVLKVLSKTYTNPTNQFRITDFKTAKSKLGQVLYPKQLISKLIGFIFSHKELIIVGLALSYIGTEKGKKIISFFYPNLQRFFRYLFVKRKL